MTLNVNEIYHGFKFLKEEKLEEINSTARLFLHVKSGAKLLKLQSDDNNKVFSITFRTPPENSKGIPHIMEHSVLCGSRKFKTKEPFIDLAKGSLNTFLNAFTFPDKTMYPVASRNEKDFFNLMDVYLDSVFYPNIYNNHNTLKQEGWHYELDDEAGEISYKGVVYNEMKGAFSAPESVLIRKIQESLFPDTQYGVESGGDPDVIPDITEKEFLDFHKKYYSPSNSYIFLYGDGDIEKELEFIDKNYLNAFDEIHVDSQIQIQSSFTKRKEFTFDYPTSPDEDTASKNFLSLNFVTGRSTDDELYLAMEILEYMLLENSAAPLKKALLDADLGKDVFGIYDNSILQPLFSIVVKNANENEKEKFNKIIQDTLSNLVDNGIDKKLIEASINIKEFQMREADLKGFPKGLYYSMKCMDSWLYDDEPTKHLKYEESLAKIKTALTTNYFENLIKKYILNNNHSTLIELVPVKGLSEAKDELLKDKLAKYKASLSKEKLIELVEENKSLKKMQSEPDTAENIKTIPSLKLSDIEVKAEILPLEVKAENNIKVLSHDVFTNKIAYISLYFDTKCVEQERLSYASLLSYVLGKVSTVKYKYEDLSNEVNINTGGIGYSCRSYDFNNDCENFAGKFIVKSKTLISKLPKTADLIGEILGYTKFDDDKRLKEIIQELKSGLEMKIFQEGHMVTCKRLFSYFSASGMYNEFVSGLEFYKFIANLEKNFTQLCSEIKSNLLQVAGVILNRNNLTVSITCDKEDYTKFTDALNIISDSLTDDEVIEKEYKFNDEAKNEGWTTPNGVQYVAKGFNFVKLGYSFTGSLHVLKTVLSLDYLWNNVRVLGGAYGGFAVFRRNGNVFLGSYRDPNLDKTLKIYDETENYLKSFNVDNVEMTKYIIGTISGMDVPLTPSMVGESSDENYLRNITDEDVQREREEILNTKTPDISNYSKLLSDVMKKDYYCVLGSDAKIKESKDLFKTLISVIK